MLVDLHVSTHHTEGSSIDPREAIRHAEASGLDGVCFAGLDTLKNVKEIQALRGESSIAIFVGLEVSTDHGKLLCFLPKPQDLPPVEEWLGPRPARGWPVQEVASTVGRMGGAVVAAHPYDPDQDMLMGDFLYTMEGLAAVEGITGTRRPNINELAIEAAEHLSLPCVGGSGARKIEDIGTGATLIRDECEDEEGLVEALRRGKVWAVAVGEPPRFHGDRAGRQREEQGRRRGRR